jgi:signal transduction histidine kinase/ligand-binding sensor domain-containing protein/DNA-binding response OmpR family regulator
MALFNVCISVGQIQYDNIRFKQLSIDEGLPHNTINAIEQDHRGFMWFGTRNGLCRFDGYNIALFSHDDADSTSLCHDFVTRLYNDSLRNHLWVATDQGICSYDYRTEDFKTYRIQGNTKDDACFLNTSYRTLLVACSNGVYSYDETTDTFVGYLFSEGNTHVKYIAEDVEKTLWLNTGDGLKRYSPEKQQFMPLPILLQPFEKRCNNVILISSNQLLFDMGTDFFVYHIPSNTLSVLSKDLDVKDFRCAATDCTGNLWVGTEYGIFVFNKLYQLIVHYEQSENDLSALNDSPIYSLYKDNAQNMWVGTYFGGVNYYIFGADQFQIYPYGSSDNHLSGKAVRQIINAPNDGLLIATEDGGLNYLNGKKEIVRAERLHKQMNIHAKNIHSLWLDRDNSIWIGLFLKGLLHYMPQSHRTVDYNLLTDEISSGFCINGDDRDFIWYGGPSGLFRIDKNKANAHPEKISSLRVQNLARLNDSILWGGTRKAGLCEINTHTLKITHLSVLPVGDIYVTYIYPDSRERIWVGTDNNGLYVFDRHSTLLATYHKEQLGSDAIKGIIEDKMNNVWVSTGDGLCLINPQTQVVDHYTVADGLPINQFNYSSACMKPNGELYFGTINGMISFFPEQVRSVNPHFNIALTGIWSNSQYMSPNNERAIIPISISELTELTLTHKQAQSLRLEYSGINYQYTQNTQYAMKMEGIDKDWQIVGNQHQVRFSNLPFGDYTLKIKASKNGIHWDEQGQKNLAITVLAPWWFSTWAYCVYALLILLIIYVAYKYTKTRILLLMRLKTEREQRINIEKMNQQKINFFTYISHDLKTPLTLILSPLQRFIQQRQMSNEDKRKLEVIYRNANRMNYLINELLTFSKIEMKQMRVSVRKGEIMHFMEELSHIFDIVAEEREIDFVVNLDDTHEEVWFSPSKLERILYNLLSNAFKYTQPGGFVMLSAKLIKENSDTLVHISVKDSGRGIPKEAQEQIFESYYQVEKRDHREGFGIGLSLTRSLIHMHKGEIHVESEVNKGSNFIVTLNVSEDAYSSDERSSENITTEEIQKYNQRIKDTIELLPGKLTGEQREVGKETLMIVEDNKEMNDYIAEIFSEKYDIIRAYNGAEAYKKLTKQLPDIIITDVMMPVMDGLEFTAQVKQDILTSYIPVILLTAKTSESDHTEGYRCGADAYITKPFNSQDLELLVQNIQKNRKLSIEHFKQAEELGIKQITNNPRDEIFMKDLVDLIMDNLTKEDFGVSEITLHFRISRSLLHTKLKSLTGCSITQFIRTIKMKEAKSRLLNGMNVSEASYAVGISDPNYFTKCFKKEFNLTPTEYLKQLKV